MTFSPAVAATLTYNATWSWWVNSTTFIARFDVADANVTIADVGVTIDGAENAAGYIQARYSGANAFSIDTLGLAPERAHVQDPVTPSVMYVTQANLDTADPAANRGFALRITYDKPMNMGIYPDVTLTSGAENFAGTLTPNVGQSWWINNLTFLAAFDVTATGCDAWDVYVHADGAFDTTGDIQAPYDGAAAFEIHMKPLETAVLAQVTSVTANVTTITDANVGSHTFTLTIMYDRRMNTNYNPTITFTPSISSTLTYDASWSWWTSSTTFVARFNVVDDNALISHISVSVTGAHDYELYDNVLAIGNAQADYNQEDVFSIDMLHPPP